MTRVGKWFFEVAVEPDRSFGAPWREIGGTAMPRKTSQVLDEYLVAAARTGDRRALGLLAERWHGKLAAHAWRLTGEADVASDAAQAAWVEIVRGLGRINDDRAFPAWAFRIVTRRCARLVRSAVDQRRLVAAMTAEPQEPAAQPADMLAYDRLRHEIGRLPPEQRSALALFYLEEMSVAEVAVALAVPLGTVKTRLMHARLKLREAMEMKGDDNA